MLKVGDTALLEGKRLVTITSVSPCGKYLRHSGRGTGSLRDLFSKVPGPVLELRMREGMVLVKATDTLFTVPLASFRVLGGILEYSTVEYQVPSGVLDVFWKSLSDEI